MVVKGRRSRNGLIPAAPRVWRRAVLDALAKLSQYQTAGRLTKAEAEILVCAGKPATASI